MFLQTIEYVDHEAYYLVNKMKGTPKKYFDLELKDVFKQEIKQNERQHFLIFHLVGNNKETLIEEAGSFFENIEGLYEDSLLGESETQMEEILDLRESCSAASVRYGKTLKYDLSFNQAFY